MPKVIPIVLTMLERIPSREADVLELYFFKKQGMKEIAELYSCTPRTVSRHIDRGLQRIKQIFKKHKLKPKGR